MFFISIVRSKCNPKMGDGRPENLEGASHDKGAFDGAVCLFKGRIAPLPDESNPYLQSSPG